jgi:hypothetical protein
VHIVLFGPRLLVVDHDQNIIFFIKKVPVFVQSIVMYLLPMFTSIMHHVRIE